MRKSLALALLVGIAVTPRAPEPLTVRAPDIRVQGTHLVLETPDGHVLEGTQMQGAILYMTMEGGTTAPVRLRSIRIDPSDSDILRHEFEIEDARHQWKPACEPNFQGETWGFPIALPEGHPGRAAPITLTCASGAVGKCVRFGYKPWKKGPHGEDLAPYHAACVHLVRADYCGDGQAHTKNGTRIQIFDHIGVRGPQFAQNQEYVFEAGWSPQGAVCVAHTRWSDLATAEDIGQSCTRSVPIDGCTETSAAAQGALVFNGSRLHPRIGD